MSLSENQDAQTLEDWAGAQHLGLTLVFTDIVDSTNIGIKLGDTRGSKICSCTSPVVEHSHLGTTVML
ncbi:MAG: hypothetical protein QOK48_1749 [Blastocatellia bacterium]|jgi:hypothetical protein|nr:hypothetical protein [Blastocatellia bacterium]